LELKREKKMNHSPRLSVVRAREERKRRTPTDALCGGSEIPVAATASLDGFGLDSAQQKRERERKREQKI
jgi:hypothetical protein